MADPLLHTAMRIEKDAIERVDALIPYCSTLGTRARRSTVLRTLVLTALPLLEAQARAAGKLPEPKEAETKEANWRAGAGR